MKYKYSLIVSQYYHSRHMFIVNMDENFIENAKKLALDLMQYKRSEDYSGDKSLGDLDPKYSEGEIMSRYNINDAGDIYFINTITVTSAMNISHKYKEDSVRQSAGYQKKAVTEGISNHHDYSIIKEAVERYFEIA